MCVLHTDIKYHSVWPRARQLETVSHRAKTKVSPGRRICLSQSKAVSWGQSSVLKEFRSPWWLRHTVEWGTELPGGALAPHIHPILHAGTTGGLLWPAGTHQTTPPHPQPVPCPNTRLQLSQASQNLAASRATLLLQALCTGLPLPGMPPISPPAPTMASHAASHLGPFKTQLMGSRP